MDGLGRWLLDAKVVRPTRRKMLGFIIMHLDIVHLDLFSDQRYFATTASSQHQFWHCAT